MHLYLCHTRLPRQLRLLRLRLDLRRRRPRLELRLRHKLRQRKNGLGERQSRPLPRVAGKELLRRSLRNGDRKRQRINAGERGLRS